MKQFTLLCMFAMTGMITSCGNKGTEDKSAPAGANPFFQASTLPYQAPPFDKIKDSDFEPALEEGMKQQLAEIQKIAGNSEAPTFENTLVAMEKSGQLLSRVSMVFGVLTSANTNDLLQQVQEKEAPKLAAHQDAIYLDAKLFARVNALYQKRNELNLDAESLRLVEYYYQQFVLAGANLADDAKIKLKKLNEEEATLSTTGRYVGRRAGRRSQRCQSCGYGW